MSEEISGKSLENEMMPDDLARKEKKKRKRAFEIDLVRGIAIIDLLFHHTSYDLRYMFGYDVAGFLDSSNTAFWAFVQPFFLCCFICVSGICCQFSRNNFKRALKVAVVAALFSAVTITADHFLDLGCSIYFNVLHLLAISMFLFAVFDHVEQKKTSSRNSRGGDLILILTVGAFLILCHGLPLFNGRFHHFAWYFVGIVPAEDAMIAMGDYTSIVPWMGMFFVGVLIGRHVYKSRETLFPNAPKAVLTISRPIEWLGRHSLVIYILHQPVALGIVYLLKFAGVLP